MDKYRVTVLREGAETDETILEIAGGGPMVTSFAPDAVRLALIEARETEGAAEAIKSPELADRVFDQATAAGRAAEQQAEGGETAEQVKVKRNRRTRQQIADDKAAQGLGFRDAAHRAEVERAQQAPALPEAVPGGVIVPEQVAVTTTFEGATPVPAAAPAGDTEGEAQAMRNIDPPYNPFAS